MDPSSFFLPVPDSDMRQRSNSDSRVSRRISKKNEISARLCNLPEICVEDCSSRRGVVNKKYSIVDDVIDEEDDFFSSAHMGRQRSSTCPDDLFRRKTDRPPTPPPISSLDPNKVNLAYSQRKPPRDKIHFKRHSLGCVTEDSQEVPDSIKTSTVMEELREPIQKLDFGKEGSCRNLDNNNAERKTISTKILTKNSTANSYVSPLETKTNTQPKANCSRETSEMVCKAGESVCPVRPKQSLPNGKSILTMRTTSSPN